MEVDGGVGGGAWRRRRWAEWQPASLCCCWKMWRVFLCLHEQKRPEEVWAVNVIQRTFVLPEIPPADCFQAVSSISIWPVIPTELKNCLLMTLNCCKKSSSLAGQTQKPEIFHGGTAKAHRHPNVGVKQPFKPPR